MKKVNYLTIIFSLIASFMLFSCEELFEEEDTSSSNYSDNNDNNASCGLENYNGPEFDIQVDSFC